MQITRILVCMQVINQAHKMQAAKPVRKLASQKQIAIMLTNKKYECKQGKSKE